MNTKLTNQLMKWSELGRRAMMMFVALAVVASSLAFSVLPARAEAETEPALVTGNCIAYHKVVRGETLYKIGLKYGMVWTKIAEANNIKNPNKIYTGQTLCIPGDEDTNAVLSIQVQKYDVNIRRGPGVNYKIIGILRSWEIVKVTGKSADGNWWRVLCPNGKEGECYVTAGTKYTKPVVVEDGDQDSDEEAVIPTFNISAVVEDTSVKITTANFPKNVDFVVRMGRFGTQAINGTYITTINSGSGGKQSFTFQIPDSLRDRKQIAIRLESDEGYFAYNWFWNQTTK